MKGFKHHLTEAQCDLIGMKQIQQFEKVVDQLFKKFDIDFKFTRHFADRMSDCLLYTSDAADE